MSARIVLRSTAVGLTALLAAACTITNVTSDSGAPAAGNDNTADSGSGTDTGSSNDVGTADSGLSADAVTSVDAGASGDSAPTADGSADQSAALADSTSSSEASMVDVATSEASMVDVATSDALTVVGNGCADPASNNQTPATATPYAIGTAVHACLRSGVDVNYYTYTVPTSPPKGGYVVVKVSEVGLQGTIDLTTQTASDSADLVVSSNGTQGGGAAQFFAAKPGATFRAVVKNHFTPPVGTPETAYTLTATFTGVNDPNAPNGTVATAAKINPSTATQGYFFAGFESTANPPASAWESWFKITLPIGTAGIALTNVPSDITGDVTFFDANTISLAQHDNATLGGNVQYDATVATAGDYYLRVQPHFEPTGKGSNPNIPVWMTQPWTLTVTPK